MMMKEEMKKGAADQNVGRHLDSGRNDFCGHENGLSWHINKYRRDELCLEERRGLLDIVASSDKFFSTAFVPNTALISAYNS